MTEQFAIGVDIGGTKIAFALIDERGKVLGSDQIPADPDSGAETMLDRIAERIERLAEKGQVAGIGVGSPGHVDPVQGIVRNAVNLKWREVHLGAGISERLHKKLPIWVHKDANAAALGEKYLGAARGYRDFVYIAIGTGLGGGAVVNDQLIVGANFYAMEIGHTGLDLEGRQCACGLRGCPEMYVSGVGLMAGLRYHAPRFPDDPLARLSNPTTSAILEAARAGSPLGKAIMEEAARWLSLVMAYHAALFNPALFVIGGGLGHAAQDFFLEPVVQQMYERVLPASRDKVQVVMSQVEMSAVGAASLVWYGLR